MLNFFKKQKTIEPTNEIIVSEKKKEYPKIVHEIHNEFLTAGDKILAEADSILKQCSEKSTEKGKRLKAIGFTNCKETKEAIEVENKKMISKELAELVNYYNINYPFNKFITEEQVKKICEKYGLVCGDISMYKGFVPEEKLKQIEQFELKKSEENTLIFDNGMCLYNAEARKDGAYFHIYKIGSKSNYSFQSNDGINYYAQDSSDIFGLRNLGWVSCSLITASFFICAPLKDMEMPKGKYIDNGYKIKNIPDPITLKPVRGGYLIVAAWGDEASDEMVVNQINN